MLQKPTHNTEDQSISLYPLFLEHPVYVILKHTFVICNSTKGSLQQDNVSQVLFLLLYYYITISWEAPNFSRFLQLCCIFCRLVGVVNGEQWDTTSVDRKLGGA